MFSFIIWDKHEQKLFGARDPFGIKPFYYLDEVDCTYFASEIKSLHVVEGYELDFDSLQQYMSFQYVPEPHTMSNQIKKMLPGHYFTKRAGASYKNRAVLETSFPTRKFIRTTNN